MLSIACWGRRFSRIVLSSVCCRSYRRLAVRRYCTSRAGSVTQFDSSSYKPAEVERKWQRIWKERYRDKPQHLSTSTHTKSAADTYYTLSMFPYPSGNLHMGHVRVYSISDCIARTQRMRGFQVLHPMGWDSFGLPAENAAIERGIQPAQWTRQNIESMKTQLNSLGLQFDWMHELSTSDASYYKWTQWLFLQLYKHNLAYQKGAFVNWDPIDKTVLANEQVNDEGRSWRSGALVERRNLRQWFFRITAFSDELLSSLDTLPGWPQQVKAMQQQWIGKSQGVIVDFKLNNTSLLTDSSLQKLRVFTTRLDTLYGVTFVAISVDHELVKRVVQLKLCPASSLPVIKALSSSSSAHATEAGNEGNHTVVGVPLGVNVVHPFIADNNNNNNNNNSNNEREPVLLPVYVSDYVVHEYGTGAVMGVPAHDERDFVFAQEHKLPSRKVIVPSAETEDHTGTSDFLCVAQHTHMHTHTHTYTHTHTHTPQEMCSLLLEHL